MKLLVTAVSIFLLTTLQAESSITPIVTIHEIESKIQNADENTLVVFDVDRTLIQMGDQILHGGKKGFKNELKKYAAYNALSKEEQDILLSIMLLKTSHNLIEQTSLDYINDLKKRNIKTIACTTLETGKFGLIDNIENWRVETMNAAGLDFSEAFSDYPLIRFESEDNVFTPIFIEGVLITGKKPKGEMLKQFLEHINWQPSKIIMIDDQLSYLESGVTAFAGTPTEFDGFLYTYVEKMLENEERNEEMIALQMTYLLENHIWLTDAEALN